MPNFSTVLSQDDIDALVNYLESLT